MASRAPEEHVTAAVFRQSWRCVAFLHWRVDADQLRPGLPADLEVEEVDGSAWVALTPFAVKGFRPLGLPALPWVSDFCETNLRTYVRHRHGRDGLWFLSLDVSSTLNAAGGRLGGVPYYLSTMSIDHRDDTVRYRCRRRIGPPARHDVVIRPGKPLRASDRAGLVDALTGRWRAFTSLAGRALEVPVDHQPWPLRGATLEHLDESILSAAGIAAEGDPIVHCADGVEAALGWPRAPRP